jgi:putative ATPase
MTLFEQHRQQLIETEAPLAARMRPRTLDEFVGQDAIVGPGRLLRRAIQADQLSSLILYGPPGTGKTTLARIIANATRAHFVSINAVLAGVKDIRDAIAIAQEKRGLYSQKTILFVDEVHRFNKAQQDALLPWVENGTVILIGATTENPYFEVNKALVSRSRIFQLKPLEAADLHRIVEQTLSDKERGYGRLKIQIEPNALTHLVNIANGDARSLLNALELAIETTPANEEEMIVIPLNVAEESIQQRAVLYDKEGDVHFDTISAFIKSIRGSDPDATLYWLARMIYAGEDPRFVFRRMLIVASEDVGLADPNAIVVVNACAASFDRVGMPEGRYPLAQAALYLATAPKSNSVMGFFDALSAVEQERETEVPTHLRDANRDKKGFGHGAGYLYPHSYREHWVAQQYLPTSLQGQVFYQPSVQGYEQQVQQQVARHREAQLAAMVEGSSVALPEILTFSPADSTIDRWLHRTLSQTGKRLATIRDRVFELANLQRHHLILDMNAGSGLLTWEAVRRVPEGGVYAWVKTTTDAEALQEQAALLPELNRPIVISGGILENLSQLDPDARFDRIVGRNVLFTETNQAAIVELISKKLRADGIMVIAETIISKTQRLYRLIQPDTVNPKLYQRLVEAEEAFYQTQMNDAANRKIDEFCLRIQNNGLKMHQHVETNQTELKITSTLLDRWFDSNTDRLSYANQLSCFLSPLEIAKVRLVFDKALRNQVVQWEGAIGFYKITF